jgi:glutamate carboxypeptidase
MLIDTVSQWLAEQYDAMLDLTQAMVNIDSGSYDKGGVDRVADCLSEFFGAHGLTSTIEDDPTYGCTSRVCTRSEGERSILFIGHRDTVFAQGEADRRPFSTKDGRAYGPGVSDMKSGLAMQAFVLVAIHRFGALPVPLVMLTTGDEEISSPSSRLCIEREAAKAMAVFNAEPGRPNGGVVIARKGSVYFNLAVHGKAAHAGANFFDGASAISALAQKIIDLNMLSDQENGITLNVGTIAGGHSVNTVAPHAHAQIDLRYVQSKQRAELVSAIERIANHSHVPGTSAQLEIYGEMLPMPERSATLDLLAIYQDAAAQSGFEAHGLFTGGCSDSGFTSAVGAPTLCAVGPTGGKGHTTDEYVELDTLVPRAQALARAVFAVAYMPAFSSYVSTKEVL